MYNLGQLLWITICNGCVSLFHHVSLNSCRWIEYNKNNLGWSIWIKSKGKRPSLRPYHAAWKTGRRYNHNLTFSSITHPLMGWTSEKSVLHYSFYWKHHFRAHLRHVRPPQRVDWLRFRSVSARGWPRRGVYCQECVVAIRTNLLHWLWDTRTHTHTRRRRAHPRWLWSCWLIFRLSDTTAAPAKPSEIIEHATFNLSGPEVSLHAFSWDSLSQRTAPMPDSAAMSKNGIVTKINSRIRTDPFTACYDLVGRELGRWVQFSYWWKQLFSGIYKKKNMSIIFQKSGNHIRFLCARVGGKPVDWTLLILRSTARMEARRAARSGNALCASWVKF